MPGSSSLDAANTVCGATGVQNVKICVEADGIERRGSDAIGGEDRLHLAGELQAPAVLGDVERPDAEADRAPGPAHRARRPTARPPIGR